jgi:hypothetical protein
MRLDLPGMILLTSNISRMRISNRRDGVLRLLDFGPSLSVSARIFLRWESIVHSDFKRLYCHIRLQGITAVHISTSTSHAPVVEFYSFRDLCAIQPPSGP